MNTVKGYKVFNPDWTCSPNGNTKQYSCPGKFEEDITPVGLGSGMHFCRKASDCFDYYDFNSENKVAEVIAYGDIAEESDKCCTNKLEIVREIPWQELLTIVNTGKDCTGLGNSGDWNSGNKNSGDCNSGDCNFGDCNSGNGNSGDWNSGDCNSRNCNSGDCNSGNRNSGNKNSGNRNSGNRNSGNRNSGNCNSGNRNSGDCNSGNGNSGNGNSGDCNSGNKNSGNRNSGDKNSGDYNSGDYNSGNGNSGDWNDTDFSSGCFNTKEQKILLFDKPSDWTYLDWLESEARNLLNDIPKGVVEWIWSANMTDEEKKANPTYETTGGYLKVLDEFESAQLWWDGLTPSDKERIKSLPNFDAYIFEKCTGIKVTNG